MTRLLRARGWEIVAAAGIAVLNADSAGDILRAARAEWRAAKTVA